MESTIKKQRNIHNNSAGESSEGGTNMAESLLHNHWPKRSPYVYISGCHIIEQFMYVLNM